MLNQKGLCGKLNRIAPHDGGEANPANWTRCPQAAIIQRWYVFTPIFY